jgi:hypothetical protein
VLLLERRRRSVVGGGEEMEKHGCWIEDGEMLLLLIAGRDGEI